VTSSTAPVRASARGGGVAGWRLLLDHLGHAVVDLWRQKVVTLFTVVVPLVWLVVVGFIAGNEVIDAESGVRVMQFMTPTAAAMGVLYASFPTVAISLAEARHNGVLRRLRATPLPLGTYLAARIGAAVVFAIGSVAVMLTVGVLAYGVQLVGSTALATAVTVLAGLVCFAAVGTAVAAWARTLALAQAASIGSAVALTFVSGMFTFGGTMPVWLDRLGDLMPLKPFAAALQDQMNPYHPEVGWDVEGVTVLVVWTCAAALLAVRGLAREPVGRTGGPPRRGAVPDAGDQHGGRRARTVHPGHDGHAARVTVGAAGAAGAAGAPGAPGAQGVALAPVLPTPVADPPSAGRLLRDQVQAGATATWRDPGSLFFAVVLPVGLYAFMLTLQGRGAMPDGTPVASFFAASMVTWGTAVAAFMNLPEAVATARDAGVLQRLRTTPLRRWQVLVGRGATAVGIGLLVAVGVLGLGTAAYDVTLTLAGVVLGAAVVVLGAVVLGACGFALAAAVPNAKAVGAVGLVVLLPLAFFSQVFVLGGPEWMGRVGDVFPLKHLQNALALAWAPEPSVGWVHVAVLAGWGVVAGLAALRWFRWDARGH
jgi:ABC-type multidrug transport system permease subunit